MSRTFSDKSYKESFKDRHNDAAKNNICPDTKFLGQVKEQKQSAVIKTFLAWALKSGFCLSLFIHLSTSTYMFTPAILHYLQEHNLYFHCSAVPL